nr:Sodium/hydrogen exchanger 9B2 [Polyrhizophydium stewartii]
MSLRLSRGFSAAVQSTIEATSRNAKALSASSTAAALLSLLLTVGLGIIGGRIAERFRQAPMLGMLVTGFLLRNALPSIIVPIPHSWTAKLWSVALTSVVARAGLSIDRHALAANLRTTTLLGVLPVAAEAVVLAVFASLAFGMPLEWAFTLSFGVACISPGVVVPLLLNLAERPEWKGSRLPPLMLAALGVDVLVATTGFGVALASALGHTHEHANDWMHSTWLWRALEEVFGGVLAGAALAALAFVLARARPRLPEAVACWAVFAASCVAMMWGKTHGFTGAASCCTILTWAAVANTWARPDVDAADGRLKSVWITFKPFLFPVIGASVSLTEMPPSMFSTALALVFCSVLVKQTVSLVVARGVGLRPIEAKLWSGLWTGKASVQATLCGAALELVHHRGLDGTVQATYARTVFCAMISAILIGIPFASGWASWFASNGPQTAAALASQPTTSAAFAATPNMSSVPTTLGSPLSPLDGGLVGPGGAATKKPLSAATAGSIIASAVAGFVGATKRPPLDRKNSDLALDIS